MKNKKIDNDLINIISNEGDPEDEFIVGIDFYYCDVTYSGYQIVDRSTVKILWDELQKDRQVYTPNMPGSWNEEYDISRLEDAFSIHSDNPDDINSMRNLFGNSVGNTDLLNMVLESEDNDEYGEDDENNYVIDVEVAKEILNGNRSTHGATEITEEAAELLSNYDDGLLFLSDLTEISDAAAESLSKFEGNLYLGINYLSDNAAHALSSHKGILTFNNLDELSDNSAQSFSKHIGGLYFTKLSVLSDNVASSLSKSQGLLSIGMDSSINKLSDSAAESLSKHEGKQLILGHILEISEKAFEFLSKHRGELLQLEFEELSSANAETLLSYKGTLCLEVSETLSDKAAYLLSKHTGTLSIGGYALENFSDSKADILSKHVGGCLELFLQENLSDNAAQSLSKYEGDLILSGCFGYNLDELSDNVAEALSNHKGNITFEDLAEISDSAAETLSKYQGKINDMDPKEWIESLQTNDDEEAH